MVIVFDMDNTLTDEMGSTVRPGINKLLDTLKSEKYNLKLWSNSTKERGFYILAEHKLQNYFSEFIFRENYDPENKGHLKDIRRIKGDILIDDDPNEIEYVKSLGKEGFLISPFRKGKTTDETELDYLYKFLKKENNFFKKIIKN